MLKEKIEELYICLVDCQYPPYDLLQGSLVEMGYSRERLVLAPGHFSVKGSVIAIFSSDYEKPIRLEYDDSILVRVCFFDLSTQLSESACNKHLTIAPFSSSTSYFSSPESSGCPKLVLCVRNG